jgi:hypothetical protein
MAWRASEWQVTGARRGSFGLAGEGSEHKPRARCEAFFAFLLRQKLVFFTHIRKLGHEASFDKIVY